MTAAIKADTKMTLFVTCVGDSLIADDVVAYFTGEPLSFLRACPVVESVDIFVPATGDVPLFEDGVGPPMIAQIDVESAARANELLATSEFAELIMRKSAYAESVEQVFLDIFEAIHCPLSGHANPPPRSATLSFVVRYYRPVASESEFISAYIAHHPPTMKRFPNIRNIICYVPLPLETANGFPNSGAFFGNEVAFDDLPALNDALASDVLSELKAGRRELFPFAHCTHYAMRRELKRGRTEFLDILN